MTGEALARLQDVESAEVVLGRGSAACGKGVPASFFRFSVVLLLEVIRECKDRGLFASTPPGSFKQQCKTIHQLSLGF